MTDKTRAYFEEMFSVSLSHEIRQSRLAKMTSALQSIDDSDDLLILISEKKESDPFPYSRGQTTAYRAYKETVENEASIFECSDLPWESDMKDFVETLVASGLLKFAVTDHSTALMSGLHALEANGCSVSGLCKVEEKCRKNNIKNGILVILPQGGKE
ncbi:MAG: hypothetical protein IIY45_02890 [Firmicutes bacterium]|nr:hypothetical protein [Bacillota bacterium]